MNGLTAVTTALHLISLLTAYRISSINININNFNNTTATENTGCQIDIQEMPLNTPLLLNLTTKDIIYPEIGTSIANLQPQEQIEISCPGGANINLGNSTAGNINIATCLTGLEFEISEQWTNLDTVLCTSRIKSAAYYTGKSCWEVGKEIEVGFEIPDGRFLQQYTACFDDNLRNVIYSLNVVPKRIGYAITGGTSPSWSEDDFYNLGQKVTNIYPRAAQRPTINAQLGLDDDDTKYITATGNYYLAKGHLTAKTDVIYNAQQMSTFHYINSAPQWQTFNGFNWYYLERNVRQYADNNLVDLNVYTGTYGVTTLPHAVTGEEVELYLYVDENNNKALPVPELLWKIVYDPLNKAGVVVLGINNPYQTNIEKSIICNDIADELTWLTFDRFTLERGFIYACTIDDFRKAYPQLPEFYVEQILS